MGQDFPAELPGEDVKRRRASPFPHLGSGTENSHALTAPAPCREWREHRAPRQDWSANPGSVSSSHRTLSYSLRASGRHFPKPSNGVELLVYKFFLN